MLKRHLFFLITLTLLSTVYMWTLQRIPNGSSHPYMIDVGETQVALNTWGTLHMTGYPLYTIVGNLFTTLTENTAATASAFSAICTLAAMGLLYILLIRWGVQPSSVAMGLLILGLLRSIWIHSIIAEVYSFSLLMMAGLWMLALWPSQFSLRARIWGLALLGGFAVAHHRALGLGTLGLLLPILPDLWRERRQIPWLIAGGVPLALVGFLPYLYLPLRANAPAKWLYAADVNTWDGFWYQFWGQEVDYLVKRPSDLAGWLDNLEGTLGILTREISLPGLLVASGCVLWACWRSPARPLMWAMTLSGLGFFAFAVAYHQAVLPEAILMMALPTLIFGVILVADQVGIHRAGVVLGLWALLMLPLHNSFILNLTKDRTGLAAIAAASDVPRDDPQAVFMLSWGPRYFAAAYSRLVSGENKDVRMVDHTADFGQLAAEGVTFYTQPDTLYGYPPEWWMARIGPVYLTAAGPNLVKLGRVPLVDSSPDEIVREMTPDIVLADWWLDCSADEVILGVVWYARQRPTHDLSVKAHLVAAESDSPLAYADRYAPVFGWRPTSTWQEGELIADFYAFGRPPNSARVILGLYEQRADGTFQNYGDGAISLGNCFGN